MQHLPDLDKARRTNQAYETHYGSGMTVNDPVTRDMAADKVIERRSWFPAIATAEWFTGPVFMVRYKNYDLTRGLDLKNRETFRARARPGEIAYQSDHGYVNTEFSSTSAGDSGHKLLYLFLIVIGIVILTQIF